ncbi:MAG: hypothetical protein GTN82_02685, partial [Candidatus Aminicenantes bacterium]|nr:hypothetical protein [Candidatus Aminicenantes bacterium]
SKGGIIWNINHGNITDEKSLKLLLDMRNIDNDPQKEVIACICDMLRKDKHSITLFDHDGRMIWKRMMSPKFTFSKIDINNYFRPSPAKFGRTNTNEIFVISKWNHQERFLSIIACHDLEGNLVSQYHHVGNLSSTLELIDLNGDGGDEIVFTGTNNLLNGEGIVGVLPLRTFYGISPPYRVEPEYSHLEFRLNDYLADEIIRGNHLVYLRFKRTDHLSRYMPQYITPVIRYFSNNVIHINLQLWKLTPNKAQIGFGYVFDKNFTLHRILPPDVILEKYHGLLKNGEIDIPLKELMNIYSKIVLRWEPGSERWVPVKRAHSN